jgi:hypothetical protein
MGWLWSSAPASEAPKQHPPHDPSTNLPEPPSSVPSPAASKQPLPQSSPQPTTKALSRDELAEAELRAFLQSLEPPPNTATQSASDITSDNHISDHDSSAPIPLTSAHTLPATVSCRTIFDNAFHCQSLGGQWNSVYRHGTLRDCSPLWYDFWWCMRTNRGSMTEEERARQVRKRYEEKERRLRGGSNSEEIWEERKVLVGRVWEERYVDEEGEGEAEAGVKRREEGRGAMRALYGE